MPAWEDNSYPLQFCRRYHVGPEQLITLARRLHATPAELSSACRWALHKEVADRTAVSALRTTIRRKVEDRCLFAAAEQCGASVDELRTLLFSLHVSPQDLAAIAARQPNITTVEALRDAIQGTPAAHG
jgi:hypothetical protein